MQQIISRVKTRRGLEGELKLKVFDTGELVVASDTKRLLVGDGVNVAGASLTPKFYKADSVEEIKSRIFEGDFALIDNRLYVAKKTGFSATSFSIADFEEITPTPDGVTINYNPAGKYEVVDLSIGAAKINASVAGSGLIKLNDAAGLSVYKDDDFFDFDVDGRLTLSNDAKSTIKFVPQSLTEMEKMIARNNIGVTAGGGGGGGGDTSVLETMLVDEINARIAADNAIGVTLTSHTNSLALKAPLASPAFTGTPTAPTASPGDVSTKLATTEFVSLIASSLTSAIDTKAPLDSAALTGSPTAPTPALVDSSTRIATTAFVHGVEGVVSSQISALSTRVATLEGGSYDNIQAVPFIDINAFVTNVASYDVQPGDGVKTQDGAINVLRKDGVKTIISDWIEIKVPDSVLSGLTSAVSVLQGEVMGLASLQLNSFESNGWTIAYGGDTATVIPYASASSTGVLNKTDFANFASKAAGTHTHTIADVTNLQTTLNGKSNVGHIHPISEITDLQLTLDGKAAVSHTHAIANITGLQTALDGKALLTHTHAISDVTGLQTALDSKASATHVHIIGDVTGLQAALDGKSAVGHTHAISDVVNLQSTLDGKAAAVHAHAITDITGLTAALAGKAASVHTHVIADVTNLQTSLDAKAAAVHTHAIADVLTLQTTLDGKAPLSHTHTIANVTGLQTALDGKAASVHTHAIADVTGLQTVVDGAVRSDIVQSFSSLAQLQARNNIGAVITGGLEYSLATSGSPNGPAAGLRGLAKSGDFEVAMLVKWHGVGAVTLFGPSAAYGASYWTIQTVSGDSPGKVSICNMGTGARLATGDIQLVAETPTWIFISRIGSTVSLSKGDGTVVATYTDTNMMPYGVFGSNGGNGSGDGYSWAGIQHITQIMTNRAMTTGEKAMVMRGEMPSGFIVSDGIVADASHGSFVAGTSAGLPADATSYSFTGGTLTMSQTASGPDSRGIGILCNASAGQVVTITGSYVSTGEPVYFSSGSQAMVQFGGTGTLNQTLTLSSPITYINLRFAYGTLSSTVTITNLVIKISGYNNKALVARYNPSDITAAGKWKDSSGNGFDLTLSSGMTAVTPINAIAISDVTGLQTALDAAGGNTVKYDVQTLTTPQKNQARTNIGATGLFTVTQNTNDITLSDGGSLNVSLPEVTPTKAGLMSASDKNLINSLAAAGGAVLYSSVQGLDSTQKLTARTNIDAASTASVAAKLDTSTFNSYTSTNDATVTNLSNKTVRVDTTSSFTFDERAQARTNIAVRDSGMVYNNADLNLLNTESILDADITSATSLVSFNGTLPNATFGPVIFFVQAGVLKVTYPTLSQTNTIATLGKGLSIVVSGNRVAFFDVTNGNTTLFDNTYASLASYTPGIVGFTGVLRRAANSAIELSGAQRMKFMSGGYWGETTTNMVNVFGPAGISDSGYWVSHTNSLLTSTKGSPLVLNGNNVSVRFLASASSTSIPGAQSGVSQYEFSIPVTYGTSNSALTVCDTNLPTGLFVMGANYDHASQTAKIRVMNLNYDAVSVTTIGWLQITV